MNFSGKHVLVTGSTTGSGAACALAFAEAGAAVMVSGRDAARGSAVLASIRAAGGRAEFLAVDFGFAGMMKVKLDELVGRVGVHRLLGEHVAQDRVGQAARGVRGRDVRGGGIEGDLAAQHGHGR